jgi:hypothetical protein
MTKFQSQIPTLLQAKLAQLGKQIRVGGREGFAYHTAKVPTDHVLLDIAPNIGPLISHWELGKFKNC